MNFMMNFMMNFIMNFLENPNLTAESGFQASSQKKATFPSKEKSSLSEYRIYIYIYIFLIYFFSHLIWNLQS